MQSRASASSATPSLASARDQTRRQGLLRRHRLPAGSNSSAGWMPIKRGSRAVGPPAGHQPEFDFGLPQTNSRVVEHEAHVARQRDSRPPPIASPAMTANTGLPRSPAGAAHAFQRLRRGVGRAASAKQQSVEVAAGAESALPKSGRPRRRAAPRRSAASAIPRIKASPTRFPVRRGRSIVATTMPSAAGGETTAGVASRSYAFDDRRDAHAAADAQRGAAERQVAGARARRAACPARAVRWRRAGGHRDRAAVDFDAVERNAEVARVFIGTAARLR